MYQGESGVQLFEVPDGMDLTGKKVYLTFKAINGKKFTKTQPDIVVSGNEIAVTFTQEDTIDLPEGPLQVQARWIGEDGDTGRSYATTVNVEGVMQREVITYEEVDE